VKYWVDVMATQLLPDDVPEIGAIYMETFPRRFN